MLLFQLLVVLSFWLIVYLKLTEKRDFANKLIMNEGKLNQVYSNALMSPRVPGLW